MVKRLRHRPLTAVTRVRFPVGSPKSAARSCGAFLFCLAAGSLWFAMPITESVAAVFVTARMQHSHNQPPKGTPQK